MRNYIKIKNFFKKIFVTVNGSDEYKKSIHHAEKYFKRRYPSRHSINKRNTSYTGSLENEESKRNASNVLQPGEHGHLFESEKLKKRSINTNYEISREKVENNIIGLSTKISTKVVYSDKVYTNEKVDSSERREKEEKISKINDSKSNEKNYRHERKLVYLFTHAPLEIPGIATVDKNNNATKFKRSVQTYRNSFNKTHNGADHTTSWRNGNNLRRNRTTTFDNINGELTEINLTKPANGTSVNLMYDQETKQSLSMKIANPLMITVACLASKFTSLFFIPGNIDEFFSQLLIVDKILKYHPKFHSDQRRFIKHLLIYSFLLSVPINIHYLYTVIEVNNEFGIMWCCILIYTNLSNFLLDLHFIYFNYLLYIRYKFINGQIKSAFNKYCQNSVVLV